MNRPLLLGALLCCAFASTAQETARTPASRSAAANGAAIFMRAGCPACHGTVGHGGTGPKLAPNTLPLAAFTTWVRNGTPGWSFGTGMPAFPPVVVSDAELADVRAYLVALPAPRSADDIPLLRP